VYHSAIDLVNDAIDLVSAYAKGEQPTQSYEKLAFHFYAYHVLLPGTYSLVLNLLAGGLSSCFRELRFMTEMIAKCYLADRDYADLSSFRDKLRGLEGDGEQAHKPVTPIMQKFDKALRSDTQATDLWKALSEESHARKYVGRVVKNVFERDNVPGYALVLPMPYTTDDLPDLLELKRYIDQFSEILRRTTRNKLEDGHACEN
ncbi:MAG: hypothetical protein ACRD1J_04695, partial [Terriglobia bacterium]